MAEKRGIGIFVWNFTLWNWFPSESGQQIGKTTGSNLRIAMREILEEFQLRCVCEKIGGERGRGRKEGNDRAFGKLADENESSIGRALHCSWQLVGSSRRGRRISLRWKGTSRGREGTEGEGGRGRGEKRRNKRGKIHAGVNVRVSIGEREEREQKRREGGEGEEQRPIDREISK